MPAPLIRVTTLTQGVQYTGDNGTDVASAVGGSVVTDDGETLVLSMNGDAFTVPAQQWFMSQTDGSTRWCCGILPTAEYEARYAPV